MCNQKFLFGLFQFFMTVNLLTRYQVKSKLINIMDTCIEEEAERLLLKRKEMGLSIFAMFDEKQEKMDDEMEEKARNLATNICEYIIPTLEDKQLHAKNEDDDEEIPDYPFDYENYNRLEMLRRTLKSPTNVNGIHNNVLTDKEIRGGAPDADTMNDDKIKVNINDISKDESSNLPTEEEILHPEKKCDELDSRLTKSVIKKIITSFMQKIPLKILIRQKMKDQKKNLREQILHQALVKHQLVEPVQITQQIPIKQQLQDAVVPRFMYQQGVRRFG